MSGGFSGLQEACNGQSYGAVDVSYTEGGTSVTPSTIANTKGAWTELVAATSADMELLLVKLANSSGVTGITARSADIAVGAAGSENIIAADLVQSISQYNPGRFQFLLPLAVPAGSRLSARCQCNVASGDAMNVSITGFDGNFGFEGAAGVDALGFSAASTSGTAISSGNAAKGSYSQIIGATSRDYFGLFGIFDSASGDFLWDVAIGGAGSENVIIPDVITGTSGVAGILHFPFVPVAIPAGSRLAARGSALGGGAGSGNLTLYGVYK